MKREDILAMSAGRELDALVAEKVMGWTEIDCSEVNWTDFMGLKTPNHILGPIDKFSTDISAAWEVVEKMRTTHKQYITIIDNPHLNYDVRFSGSKSSAYERLSSLPHAICRAALHVVLEEGQAQ